MIAYDPRRWWTVLFTFTRSPVFRTLLLDVAVVGVYAAIVVWVERDYVKVAVPLGPQVLSLLGIILGLLLVFRTNTAYDRWWEGRRLWGQLVNVSRTLSQALDALLEPGAVEARARYATLLASLPTALRRHLRGEDLTADDDPTHETDLPLPTDGARHLPNRIIHGVLRGMDADVRTGRLPREAILALMPSIAALHEVVGGCERIRNTPIPFSYSSYVKQFIVLFAILVPFALANEFGYGTVLAEMFLFFSTMGLELLAVEIEQPFGTDGNDLPLDEISSTIATNVRTALVEGRPTPSVARSA